MIQPEYAGEYLTTGSLRENAHDTLLNLIYIIHIFSITSLNLNNQQNNKQSLDL